MAKKKLSRDQKRKQALAKRAHSGAGRTGAQAEFVTRATQQVIAETFMSYGLAMHDGDVLEALRQLTVDVQRGQVSQESAGAELPNAKGALVWNIKQAWGEKRTLANVPGLLAAQALQALAHRVDDISAKGESRSYLRFLQGTQDGARALVSEIEGGLWSDDEADLRRAGLAWLKNSNEQSYDAFRSAAEALMGSGKAQVVAEVCQYLYGTVQQEAVEKALRPLVDAAHNILRMEAEAAEEPVPPSEAAEQPVPAADAAVGDQPTPAAPA